MNDSTLRRIYTELGWGRAALAKAVGVAESTLMRWEVGEHLPRSDRIGRLCLILEVMPADLGLNLGGEE